MTPSDSSNMYKLWNALLSGQYKEEEGVVRLSDDNINWLTEPSPLLFVRKCHVDLFDIIMGLYKPQLPERGIVITGNPGIGKSWFLSYCLLRLANEKKTVFFESVRRDERWLFKPDGTATQIKGDWPLETEDPSTVFLFDPYGGAPREPKRVTAFTVVASSPDKRNFKEFAKQTGSRKFYMPCWTWDEIELILPHLPFEPERSRQRYEKFGGIPHYIFDTKEDWDRELDDAIAITSCSDLYQSIGGPEMLRSVSHKVLQYKVDIPSYKKSHVIFASDYVSERIVQRLAEREHAELVKFVKYVRDPVISVVRGNLFESLAHTELCKGGQFRVRNLETGVEDNDVFPPLVEKYFDKLDLDCFQAGTYARPRSKQFTALDSFGNYEKGPKAFQITINESHGLNYNGISAMLQLQKPLDIFFVVPPDKFDTFPKQRITKATETQTLNIENDLQQHVLLLLLSE